MTLLFRVLPSYHTYVIVYFKQLITWWARYSVCIAVFEISAIYGSWNHQRPNKYNEPVCWMWYVKLAFLLIAKPSKHMHAASGYLWPIWQKRTVSRAFFSSHDIFFYFSTPHLKKGSTTFTLDLTWPYFSLGYNYNPNETIKMVTLLG